SQRLRIGRSNFRLPSDIQSKEATLQVVYDVLRNSPIFKAFQVTANVPEIYMQEFWATAKLHHNSIRFKIDTRKSVRDLEAFREMLHISPRTSNQPFADLPTEEEVLEFLRFLGHSHDIRYLTDVNVNKLYQPWRSFASAKALELTVSDCLKLKCFGDSITESTLISPILSGRTLCIRIHWHYIRDDALFSTIKVVSRHQATQQYGTILPIELTTAEIRNSKAYQEYYACAMGEATPKPKVSARKKKGDSASSTTPPTLTPTTTAESAPRLSASAKGKQPLRATTHVEPTDLQRTEAEQLKIVLKRSRQKTHISQQSGSDTGEGTGSKPGVPDVPSDDSEEELFHEEGKESDDDSDEGSDKDSDETAKSGAGKDGDEDDDEDNDDDDEEEQLAKDDEEDKETGKGGDEV
nr:hypothetical protein [Tanacetum cinerariifolium]